MSNLIATDAQTTQIDSALINLFELELPESSGTLYFHAGVEEDLSTVFFRDNTSPYTAREYVALPALIDGLDMQADGASSRPVLTVANVGSLFSDLLPDFNNDDLVGMRLTRRQTLAKHLQGGSAAGANGSAPTEFRVIKYFIDRVASETNIAVTFELAMPFDLENVKLPRRVVVGKFCSWQYQGVDTNNKGGCTFPQDSKVTFLNDAGTTSYDHYAFFTIDDKPLVLDSKLTDALAPNWATGEDYIPGSYTQYDGSRWWRAEFKHTSATENNPTQNNGYWIEVFPYEGSHDATNWDYAVGEKVFDSNRVWKCTVAHNSSTSAAGTIIPSTHPGYWVRIDICGKQLSSCKCRFGFQPTSFESSANPPDALKDSAVNLPFGGFPGTLKF
tara:strand:- start:982 stop:2145 length:1164 start_codon:yes stop_codon:yes gene_type:complete